MIDDVEKWLAFVEDRNLAVHDYVDVTDKDYLATIEEFIVAAKTLSKRKT